MKRMLTFAKRCAKEILRDPIHLFFGSVFPLILLLLLHTIQKNIPVSLFEIGSLTPGITVFSLSFLTLFAGTLVAKDRESAFLQRLYTTPLTAFDFIVGYTLPLLPIALGQAAVCYLAAVPLGLPLSIRTLHALLGILPMALFHIALGLLCGSVLSVKQTSSLCGALLTNLAAWLSGVWFDLSLAGEWLKTAADALPFLHAVEAEKALLQGSFETVLPHALPILLYAGLTTAAAVFFFLRQMKQQ
ncbi:MAG: ABC transporter permease [Ruminococcaceae bacterium]|nr:ABC transporter permease [Oscillospiraceae bacterium]